MSLLCIIKCSASVHCINDAYVSVHHPGENRGRALFLCDWHDEPQRLRSHWQLLSVDAHSGVQLQLTYIFPSVCDGTQLTCTLAYYLMPALPSTTLFVHNDAYEWSCTKTFRWALCLLSIRWVAMCAAAVRWWTVGNTYGSHHPYQARMKVSRCTMVFMHCYITKCAVLIIMWTDEWCTDAWLSAGLSLVCLRVSN